MRAKLLRRLRAGFHRGHNGQTLPLLVLMVIVIVVFVGMGIDVGFAYLTRASLAKGVDAACIAGVRNLSQGQAAARQIALSTFDMNYKASGVSGRQVAAPSPTAEFQFDADGNLFLNVDATVDINTYFIRVLPSWRTMRIGAHGQAIRQRVYLSLVLDRSGSMQDNGGCRDLPPAVDLFVGQFDDTLDHMAVATFASAANIPAFPNLPMSQPFKSAVSNAVPRGCNIAGPYKGGTFAQGGLTNGYVMVKNVVIPGGQKAIKVCVFFTDGLANIVQDTLKCSGVPTLRNFGGYDVGNTVDFVDPANGNSLCQTAGGTPACCPGVAGFTSSIDGSVKSFTRGNVSADARYRSLQVATDMRAGGIIVYSIGLGNNLDLSFLQQIANDPASPTPDPNPNAPVGEAFLASDSSKLAGIFDELAKKILLRLTQ